MPAATPPAAGQAWGGLVFTAATPAGPVEYVSEQTRFRGRTYAVMNETAADGSSRDVLVRQNADGSWAATSLDVPGASIGRLAASDSVIVAIQTAGQILKCQTDAEGFETCSRDALKTWTSSDGEVWKEAGALPGSANLWLNYLTWGRAGFIAGSGTLVHGRRTPVTWTSKDGLTWAKSTLTSTIFVGAIIDDVAAVPGGYVATGGTGRVEGGPGYMGTLGGALAAWWSTDGEHWAKSSVEVPQAGAQVIGPIFVSDGGLLAQGFLLTAGDNGMGYISAAWTSVDGGKTWHYHATDTFGDARESFVPEIPVTRYGVLAGDGHRLVSITLSYFGDFATGVWESFDGSSWRKLRVDGLDYLNGIVGPDWYASLMSVDDSGVVLSLRAGEQSVLVRGWAVP